MNRKVIVSIISGGLLLALAGCGGSGGGTASSSGGSTNGALNNNQNGFQADTGIAAKGQVPVGTPGVIVLQPPANPLEFALRMFIPPAYAQATNLAGYRVTLYNIVGQPVGDVIADADGVGRFGNMIPANYRVTFTHPTENRPLKVQLIASVINRVTVNETADPISTAVSFVGYEVAQRIGPSGFAVLNIPVLEQTLAGNPDFVDLVNRVTATITSAQDYLNPVTGQPTLTDLGDRARAIAAALDLAPLQRPLSGNPGGGPNNPSNSQVNLTLSGDANFPLDPVSSNNGLGLIGGFNPSGQAPRSLTVNLGTPHSNGITSVAMSLNGNPDDIATGDVFTQNGAQSVAIDWVHVNTTQGRSWSYFGSTTASGTVTVTSFTPGAGRSGSIGLTFADIELVPRTGVFNNQAAGTFRLNGTMLLNVPIGQ